MGAYAGYVKVDWAKVHQDVLRHFDVDRNGSDSALLRIMLLQPSFTVALYGKSSLVRAGYLMQVT